MTLKSAISHLCHKSTPLKVTNISLDSWCHQSQTQSNRVVQKVEMCTALCAGEDAWGMQLSRDHHHTLLRVLLEPTHSGTRGSDDTVLVERVLSTGGAYHSVAPIAETFLTGGTMFHPDVHDRACIIVGDPATALAHDLEVERTLTFSDRTLTLAQFAQILALISRMTEVVCDGGECQFQSRSFTFTCFAALAPTLPPREAGRGVGSKIGCGTMDDSVFELSAEALLVQVPWLIGMDDALLRAIELVTALKDKPQGTVKARLYH